MAHALDGSGPTTNSRRRRYRLRSGSFRHPKGEDGQGHGRSGAGGEKGGAVSEVIDDYAGSKPASGAPMISAIAKGVKASKIPAPTPSSTWTPTCQKLLSERV